MDKKAAINLAIDALKHLVKENERYVRVDENGKGKPFTKSSLISQWKDAIDYFEGELEEIKRAKEEVLWDEVQGGRK